MSASKPTPMIQQYLSIKEQYKDAILFYRMGDFYEMFFEDAQTASQELEITLTSRNKNESVPVPMCGVPHRAVQGYIARLIDRGYKVALCDQVEDPAKAKGLVKREVVRVVTPGMILDNELLDAKTNNFLMALASTPTAVGIAYLDISTGIFRLAETSDRSKVVDEVQRIGPSEALLPQTLQDDSLAVRLRSTLGSSVNWLDETAFDPQRGRRRLVEQFQTRSLEGFGCDQMQAALGAAGALLDYVGETQKQAVDHFRGIETYSLDDYLIVDYQSRQNLELEKSLRDGASKGTLIAILDKTITAMGSRCLKQWLRYPLLSPEKIGRRLDAVEEAVLQNDARRRITEALKTVYDLERLNSKIAMGRANARDLLALARSLASLPSIWEALALLDSELFGCDLPLDEFVALGQMIAGAIRDDAPPVINEGGMIKQGYDAELDELIQISKDGKGYLARLEVREKEATGINTLKVRFNKVFGYYIEVSKLQTNQVPDHYVRKQTLVNAERYITDELKQFETKVFNAEEQRSDLELAIFNQIREQVRTKRVAIQEMALFLARLDCLLALAEVADQNDYRRPKINTHGAIHIQEGRHPVVEKMITGERFVPNTLVMDNQAHQVLIITGPNMAGKSTVLRQVALTVIMAQMGSFVPAAAADMAVVDRIFTRVGALDNLSAGQSTFMVEMEETANILNNASAQSLVIMDEIGRGTSTYDGLSIAWAVVEYLHDLKGQGVKTLFATHYHELTELDQDKTRVENLNIAVKEWQDQIIFLRKLVAGGTNRSYGIQVARLAGIPNPVIERSKKILDRIESCAPAGSRVGSGGDSSIQGQGQPVQLDLFRPAEKELATRLASLDLNLMTPLEALNLLQEMQQKLKKETH